MRCQVKSSFAATLLWLVPGLLLAQREPQQQIEPGTFIEEMFPLQDENLHYEDLYESLFQLYSNPININRAAYEDLSALYILSSAQIESILSYRLLNGEFLSIYELQAVPGLDIATIGKILPFITINEEQANSRPLWQRVVSEKNNYLILRAERSLQMAAGYRTDTTATDDVAAYAGGPMKQYARFRVSHPGDFSFGFTMEKDAGEKLRWNPGGNQYGADFYSIHAHVKSNGRLKTINLGDYQLQMGQGLVFGAGFGAGKGAETILSIKRNSFGLRPYTSVLETGFFRGAAATYSIGRWEITGLASRVKQDGTVKTDSTSDDSPFRFVSGILNSGYHRTPTELATRDQLTELNTGGAVSYKTSTFQAGLNTLYTLYSTPIEKRPTLANSFEFGGKSNMVASVHLSKLWQNTQFFGEAARSSSGGMGLIGGFLMSLGNTVGVSMAARSYDRDFHSFYARAFGENTRNINEKGIYWGFKWQPVRKITFTAYYDHFSFPWLRYNADAPSAGHEYMSMISYSPSKTTRLYGQFRQQTKAVNGAVSELNVRSLADERKENYVVSLEHQATAVVSFKSRVQLSRTAFQDETGMGYALAQDINLTWNALKVGARMALFDTDSDNRQYMYEKDALYAFSIPSYSGKGIRNYLLLQYKMNSRASVWIRWAQFSYYGPDSIGTGHQKVEGPVKGDVKIQLLVRPF